MTNGSKLGRLPTDKPHHRTKDRVGYRTHMLEVVAYGGSDGRRTLWRVRCDCGVEKLMEFSALTKGTKSCGCSRWQMISTANRTHGMTKHPAYQVWKCMRQRCTIPTHRAWKNYGGRGIRVCAEWLESFENFWRDMGESFAVGLELDRKDNNGDYSPENCRWVTARENTRNKRSCVYIRTPYGPMRVWDAVEASGLKKSTLFYRQATGVPAEKMFDPPNARRRFTP